MSSCFRMPTSPGPVFPEGSLVWNHVYRVPRRTDIRPVLQECVLPVLIGSASSDPRKITLLILVTVLCGRCRVRYRTICSALSRPLRCMRRDFSRASIEIVAASRRGSINQRWRSQVTAPCSLSHGQQLISDWPYLEVMFHAVASH